MRWLRPAVEAISVGPYASDREIHAQETEEGSGAGQRAQFDRRGGGETAWAGQVGRRCARRDRWAEEDLGQVGGGFLSSFFPFSYFLFPFQFEIFKLISNPCFEFRISNFQYIILM
jgi:hypothetical protein